MFFVVVVLVGATAVSIVDDVFVVLDLGFCFCLCRVACFWLLLFVVGVCCCCHCCCFWLLSVDGCRVVGYLCLVVVWYACMRACSLCMYECIIDMHTMPSYYAYHVCMHA